MWVLGMPPFFVRIELLQATVDEQKPVDLIPFFRQPHQQPTRRKALLTGSKVLQAVIKNGMRSGQLVERGDHLFGGGEARNVGLVAGPHVVRQSLHEGDLVREDEDFWGFFGRVHETEYKRKVLALQRNVLDVPIKICESKI
jgi:hypothetical protein